MKSFPVQKFCVAILCGLLASLTATSCVSGAVTTTKTPLAGKRTLVLADRTRTPLIVLAPDATASEKFAAQELATYLGKITGQAIKVEEAKSTPATKQPLIVLGRHPLNADLQLQKLGVEESVMMVEPNRVRIVGGREPETKLSDGKIFLRDRGTLYGVYNLLDSLGVRWYRPENWGEFVPQMSRITLPLGRSTSKPVYKYRYGIANYRWWEDETYEQRHMAQLWAVRNRQNTDLYGAPPEYGGFYIVDFSHSYERLLPRAKYFDKHPEYYALRDGKRSNAPFTQLALGNPAVQDAVAEKIIALAKAAEVQEIFSIEPEDFSLWGEEPESVAMDDPNLKAAFGSGPSMSNRVTAFNNIIARKLAQAVPGAKVGWLAYNTHTEVPTKVKKLEPNTVVQVAAYAGAYSDYSKALLDPTSEANARFLKVLDGWGKLTTVMVHDYFSGYQWHGPMPLVATMTDRLREYRRHNVIGVYSETHQSWGPQGLDLYLYTRLLWNPDLDVQRELNLYYQNYYGPAAAPMKAYHELIENASTSTYWGSGGYGLDRLFTKALIDKLTPQITQARELAKGKAPYEQRIEGVWAGYEYVRRLREFLDLKDQNKLKEATQAMDDLEAFILSYKEGDVFDNGPKIFPQIFQGVSQHGKDIAERGRLMRSFENPTIAQDLTKNWRFQTDAKGTGLNSGWMNAEFDDKSWPLLNADQWWQEQGFADYHGTAWYRKKFLAPAKKESQCLILHFGAVDGDATVYVNGQKVGEHLLGKEYSGWDKPFFFDVTDQVLAGQPNQIAVRVKKDIYKSGIWGGVQLLVVDKVLPTPGA
jgi:hypothetical protein